MESEGGWKWFMLGTLLIAAWPLATGAAWGISLGPEGAFPEDAAVSQTDPAWGALRHGPRLVLASLPAPGPASRAGLALDCGPRCLPRPGVTNASLLCESRPREGARAPGAEGQQVPGRVQDLGPAVLALIGSVVFLLLRRSPRP